MKHRLWLPLLIAGLGLALLLIAVSQPVQAESTPSVFESIERIHSPGEGLSGGVRRYGIGLSSATYAWSDESDQPAALFGNAVRSAGDVNGDGYDDVIVGTHSYDQPGYTDAGGAWVYYGSDTGLSDTPAWTATLPLESYGFFGWAVGTAGDVNGDDYDDIMVAMVNYDSSFADEGAVFVWYGSETGLGADYDWMARGDATYAHLGWDLGTAGDIDNDGYDDIIVGAFRYDDNEISHAYVWFGSESGLGEYGTPLNADWTASAPVDNVENGHAFGSRVGTAGDVNGDTYADVFVGAPLYDNGQTDEGAVFIWYGSDTGLGPDGTIGNADWSAESNQEDAQLSGDPRSYVICGAASAGDVNGDGYDDFIAGSHYYDNGETNEGIALLWFGAENGLDPDGSRPVGDPTNADWTAESDQDSAYLGFEFGESGDLNGDGFDDVLVSTSLFNVTTPVTITSAGAAFVWFGSELGPIENGTPSNADWVAEGDQAAAYLGFSLDWAGDVNGDELTDVIAGAPYYDNGEVNEGRAFVYHGQPDPIAGLSAVNDSPTLLGELTTFTATITSGTMVSYTWQFGDEVMGVGRVVTHIYEVPGVYTATVTVSNTVSMDTALTTVTVLPINEPPVANDDSDSVVVGGSVTTDVLSNDSDPDDPVIDLTVSIDTAPLYGTATVQPDGSITYQHDGSETTSDSYVYRVCDPDQACDTATVSITISPTENKIYLPLVLRE